ncbi:hypothetical protein [Vibrio mangrovi]|uniref:Uncharacterized protein n=1 Tax=Vibrio mangrovi TaxID=474394 RepID=A0A1Y6IUG3_9VIBR|nr:hypothetical protein [Vibrio mangrovi]MDW6003524.1 hypothetical protein [Vibrio mangrovi]SMR99683.1 hypothetical protein VIM7927_00911 [Vibrio mangrovi]
MKEEQPMKTGLRLLTVALPIPTVLWVMKGDHPKWVKFLSVYWAICTALIFYNAYQTPDGLQAYPYFILISLVAFGILNSLVMLIKKHLYDNRIQKRLSR